MESSTVVLEAKNISKIYKEGSNNDLVILEDSSFFINRGEVVSFVGPSGSGKSTLLQICGLLDKPTSGDVIINGISTFSLSDNKITELRKFNLGFVYQSHHLFPEFTAVENVMIPLLIRGIKKNEAFEKASELLQELGLGNRILHKPSALSGGEKQRVAIARALITNSSIILADEPTGNLDKENSFKILDILVKSVKIHNSSLLIVTHDLDLTKYSDQIITIKDRKIVKY